MDRKIQVAICKQSKRKTHEQYLAVKFDRVIPFKDWWKLDLKTKVDYLSFLFAYKRGVIEDSYRTNIDIGYDVIDFSELGLDEAIVEAMVTFLSCTGKKPTILFVGREDAARIWQIQSEQFAMKGQIHLLINGRPELFGMEVHVIPWMQGIFPCHPDMLDRKY